MSQEVKKEVLTPEELKIKNKGDGWIGITFLGWLASICIFGWAGGIIGFFIWIFIMGHIASKQDYALAVYRGETEEQKQIQQRLREEKQMLEEQEREKRRKKIYLTVKMNDTLYTVDDLQNHFKYLTGCYETVNMTYKSTVKRIEVKTDIKNQLNVLLVKEKELLSKYNDQIKKELDLQCVLNNQRDRVKYLINQTDDYILYINEQESRK